MRRKFSKSWKTSTQPRKQRKFRANAPPHIRQSFMGCHLSKELKKQYGKRSAGLRKGDKVKVVRGGHKGKTGSIDRVFVKKRKATITGIDFTKKEGSKIMIEFDPSNLIITELNMDDKTRRNKIEGKAKKPSKKSDEQKGAKENKTRSNEKQELKK